MLIARNLKEKNIAEYLLYMWQIEDLIRAERFDIDNIYDKIIDLYDQPEETKQDIKKWYENLIAMMGKEEVAEKGHIAINNNVLAELTNLHLKLLQSPEETEYSSAYYKTLPFIVELRSKSGEKTSPELETCFSALYGFLLMRLQRKEVSGETQAAISQISSLLRLLSSKWSGEHSGKLNTKE